MDTNLANSDSQTYQIRSVAPDYTPAQLRAADRALPTAIRQQDLRRPRA